LSAKPASLRSLVCSTRSVTSTTPDVNGRLDACQSLATRPPKSPSRMPHPSDSGLATTHVPGEAGGPPFLTTCSSARRLSRASSTTAGSANHARMARCSLSMRASSSLVRTAAALECGYRSGRTIRRVSSKSRIACLGGTARGGCRIPWADRFSFKRPARSAILPSFSGCWSDSGKAS
jgi:hypothetical protein